jgi:hypothetical protein
MNLMSRYRKAAQQRAQSKTLRAFQSQSEIRQVLECVRCCAALVGVSRLCPVQIEAILHAIEDRRNEGCEGRPTVDICATARASSGI